MLDFPLTGSGPLSTELRRRGFAGFAAVAEYVRGIPYGRTAAATEVASPLYEHRGTCSSKHRLLAALALESGRTDIGLRLGLYEMSERNTPGVGAILASAGVDAIPEAHCYLTHEGVRYDFTGLASGPDSPFDSLTGERAVAPDELPAIKKHQHADALARWAAGIGIDVERAWDIREKCIARLAEVRTASAGSCQATA